MCYTIWHNEKLSELPIFILPAGDHLNEILWIGNNKEFRDEPDGSKLRAIYIYLGIIMSFWINKNKLVFHLRVKRYQADVRYFNINIKNDWNEKFTIFNIQSKLFYELIKLTQYWWHIDNKTHACMHNMLYCNAAEIGSNIIILVWAPTRETLLVIFVFDIAPGCIFVEALCQYWCEWKMETNWKKREHPQRIMKKVGTGHTHSWINVQSKRMMFRLLNVCLFFSTLFACGL